MDTNTRTLIYVAGGMYEAGAAAVEALQTSGTLTLGPPWTVIVPVGMAIVAAGFAMMHKLGYDVPAKVP